VTLLSWTAPRGVLNGVGSCWLPCGAADTTGPRGVEWVQSSNTDAWRRPAWLPPRPPTRVAAGHEWRPHRRRPGTARTSSTAC